MKYSRRTLEHSAGLGSDVLDVNRGFFRFRCNVAARCCNKQRLGFTIAILQVEAFEEDDGCGYDALSQRKFPAELVNG
jgi:hypothetical protein